MKNNLTYNALFDNAMKRYNLSNIEVAKWLNVTPTMISLWRNNHHCMNPKKYFYPFMDKLDSHLQSLNADFENFKGGDYAENQNDKA